MTKNGKTRKTAKLDETQFKALVLESLEHELGGVAVYVAALECAVHPVRKEWQRYLEQTRTHVDMLENLCVSLGIDPEEETPGRTVVRHIGESLVHAMKISLTAGDSAAAQIVAAECVVLAETKDHFDWSLLGSCVEHLPAEVADELDRAYERIEDEEDEHLYHSKGWCRELRLEALGLHAVLPPPEETKNVKTAIGAARAEQQANRAR